MPTPCQLRCHDCWQKKQLLQIKQPNLKESKTVDQTSPASPSHVLQNCQAQQLRVKWSEGRASNEVWREEATVSHKGRQQATEGRAGPCGDTSALPLSGSPTTVMSAVGNTKVE